MRHGNKQDIVCCSMLQYVAVCCSVWDIRLVYLSEIRKQARHCVLQCVAVCCSVLQCLRHKTCLSKWDTACLSCLSKWDTETSNIYVFIQIANCTSARTHVYEERADFWETSTVRAFVQFAICCRQGRYFPKVSGALIEFVADSYTVTCCGMSINVESVTHSCVEQC